MDSKADKSHEPTSIKEKMEEVSRLVKDIVKDIFSKANNRIADVVGQTEGNGFFNYYYKKGADNNTLRIVTTAIVAALTLIFFIVRWNNVSFINALFAFLLPLGYYRPRIEKKIFLIILAVAIALFIVRLINDPWIHFSSLFPIILIYIIGETIRYVGWSLGGYLGDKGVMNRTSSLIRDFVQTNSQKRTLLIVTAISAVIIIASIINVPSRSRAVPYRIEDSGRERSNDERASASGTYYWSNGALYLSITISGDRWYSSANFDVVSNGRVKNKALYDDTGLVQLGRIINSNSISYSNTILNRK